MQLDAMDCGPTCLQMVAKHFGKRYSLQTLRKKSDIGRVGVSLLGIAEGAESIGFRTLGVSLETSQLTQVPVPFIAHWRQQHFIVVYKVTKNKVRVADPASGLIDYPIEEFKKSWLSDFRGEIPMGLALLLEPTDEFHIGKDEDIRKEGFSRIFSYLWKFNSLLYRVALTLLISGTLQLFFPFLTRAVIDKGVNTSDLNFVFLVLGGQLLLFAGRTSADFLRSWLLLHISSRININLISDFLVKLMKLPLAFFDIKMYGDITRRIQDHSIIQNFLTSQFLNLFLSVFSISILSIALFIFNKFIFFTFISLSLLYVLWILVFLKKRREINYRNFMLSAKESSFLLQTIQGMQDIKLANAETASRWRWENIQAKTFKVNIKGLALDQYQQTGGLFINELKNILITFLTAKSVISGNLSLGAMLAIQQIVGQMNGPMEQIISFVYQLQDAKISLERINEIHHLEEEANEESSSAHGDLKEGIRINNVNFSYAGAGSRPVLIDLNVLIPAGKITAIVGASGSGKTTLLKLLLKFYEPVTGSILLDETNLNVISHKFWRSKCGVVMQEGYIFTDTIANNIAVGSEEISIERLNESIRIANLKEFVDSLPLGIQTMIGAEGTGISQGQKQRILIARSVYKNPDFLLFDEATNSLDANNEKEIMENLQPFFNDKTVVIVAHRLSTVRDAHNIIVLDNGRMVESGNHQDLIVKRGLYYSLVKNQLELGT